MAHVSCVSTLTVEGGGLHPPLWGPGVKAGKRPPRSNCEQVTLLQSFPHLPTVWSPGTHRTLWVSWSAAGHRPSGEPHETIHWRVTRLRGVLHGHLCARVTCSGSQLWSWGQSAKSAQPQFPHVQCGENDHIQGCSHWTEARLQKGWRVTGAWITECAVKCCLCAFKIDYRADSTWISSRFMHALFLSWDPLLNTCDTESSGPLGPRGCDRLSDSPCV